MDRGCDNGCFGTGAGETDTEDSVSVEEIQLVGVTDGAVAGGAIEEVASKDECAAASASFVLASSMRYSWYGEELRVQPRSARIPSSF